MTKYFLQARNSRDEEWKFIATFTNKLTALHSYDEYLKKFTKDSLSKQVRLITQETKVLSCTIRT